MRAIFLGTPAIAVPSLRALAAIARVVGVVCQPDRPSGRGLHLHAPPIKVEAERLGVQVVQPTKIKTPDFLEWVRERRADIALVLAYGRILPPTVLAAPLHGCVNLHASILPSYRGAAPINWAIVKGETETGISLMQMDEGLDTGPVYSVHKTSIGPDETAGELAARVGELAAEVVRDGLPRVLAGELVAVPQDATRATFAPVLKKEDGRIVWTKSAVEVHNHVRGMTPWPGAFSYLGGKLIKILETRRSTLAPGQAPPGTLVAADPATTLVACGKGALEIVRAQVEGRKPLAARDLVVGRTFGKGAQFD